MTGNTTQAVLDAVDLACGTLLLDVPAVNARFKRTVVGIGLFATVAQLLPSCTIGSAFGVSSPGGSRGRDRDFPW
jgi:hypothetical protein